MNNEDRILLTMEERLERSARSLAASPEAAAKLVERFSRLPAFQVFFGKPDVDAMYGLTGEFWDYPAVDMGSYYGFTQTFRLAVERDNNFFQLASLGGFQEKGRKGTQGRAILLNLVSRSPLASRRPGVSKPVS